MSTASPDPAAASDDHASFEIGQLVFELTRASPQWPLAAELARTAEAALSAAAARVASTSLPKRSASCALRFADDDAIRGLNRRYRGKDSATNVLAFEADRNFSFCDEPFLGDIVLAYETVFSEARRAEIRFDDHVAHLVMHGFLHLIGYRHDEPVAAEAMEALEVDALAAIGVDNPYVKASVLDARG